MSKNLGFLLSRALYVLVLLSVLTPASAWARTLQQGPEPAQIDGAVLEQIQGNGTADFWILMEAQADLSGAETIAGWGERGQFVVDHLQAVANQTQPGVISVLEKAGASYKSYWIVNAIRVNGDDALVNELSPLPEVARIIAAQTFALPEPLPAPEEGEIGAVEWNVARINAPQVWSTFGVTGQGIVVANIDSGVQYNHPALVGKYRGNLGGGSFDHNYNWFDPSNVCGTPSTVPCDNNGHGTHTMGTMVGDDGGSNQIGVAPGATFIMAKGCETNSCSDAALLASAQWILAPTNLSGANPRPDLRPHVVNNSWGGGGGDFWYQSMVQAWVASGIFPAFSNGNSGPSCSTSGSPGDYLESYSSGAFDINNAIASFSSRGPSDVGGLTKPNIAAPGVSVRSSVPSNSYSSFSGTSMASPHTAAAVALMWSAAPALTGDITQTRNILNQTAVDTSDLSCGGTAANNNVWGEGKLDAFAAVSQSPIGQVGALEGTVTDAGTGLPVAGAAVEAAGPLTRNTTTDANGYYSFPVLSVGDYTVTVSKFGYADGTANVTILDGQTTVQNIALVAAPSYSVSGTVRDQYNQPIANASVTILGTPIPPATTDSAGNYSFASVPAGTYDVSAAAGRCNDPQTLELVLSGNMTGFDFALPLRTDSFGYYCQVQEPVYIEASTPLALSGDDASLRIDLPFAFPLYGESYSQAWICTNGQMNFLAANCSFSNAAIPTTGVPNGAIYPFWDDLYVDASASMHTELLSSPSRFVIEWRNVRPFGDTTRRMDFEVVLYEGGQILTQYRNIANDARERGSSATLGIENGTGTVAFRYSYNEAVIDTPDFAVMYRLPPSAFVEGTVTNFNDGMPLVGATVKAMQGSSEMRNVTTDENGFYRFQVPLGTYDIEASMPNYETRMETMLLETEDATYPMDFSLKTARGEVDPAALEFVVPMGESRTKTLMLSNTGSLEMSFSIGEIGGGQVMANQAGSAASLAAAIERGYDPNGATSEGLNAGAEAIGGPSIQAVGDVLKAWAPSGMTLPWGVGFNGDVWLSDPSSSPILRGKAFDTDGAALGASYDCPFGGTWCGDMAYDAGRDWMCSVNVGGDNGIYCWDPGDGSVQGSITGAFDWTAISQRGLAYRPDDDSFYIGGWNDDVLYHLAGFSHATPGTVLDQCAFTAGISGLAWNPAYGVVWVATNSATDTVYQLSPTCGVLGTLAHPSPGFDGGGLEMDYTGNLWMVDQDPKMAYLIDSGLPSFTDVPWLDVSPASGSVATGGSQALQVTADASGLGAGVYEAMLIIQTNSGREPDITVPVRLIVPAYIVGVDAGSKQDYLDTQGETWLADQKYTSGGWGYVNNRAQAMTTKKDIAGTDDDPLFQTARVNPSEYRFDVPVAGVYQVELDFAELQSAATGTRVFDVIAELNEILLFGHDIAYEVGGLTADTHTFYITIHDGQLNLRFNNLRGFAAPIVNAIRIIHRPDMTP